MPFAIASDLHFEFQRDKGLSVSKELADPEATLLCAGDLATCDILFDSISKLCNAFKHVVYTPGNHEYYYATRAQVNRALDKACQRNKNLTVLNKASAVVDGVTIHGVTLWFPKNEAQVALYGHQMSDFTVIPTFAKWVGDANREACEYLAAHVKPGDVVMTHHLPLERSIHPKYKNDPLNPFFLCDMRHVIEDNKPSLWVHGHTHESFDYIHADTRVVCNPFGYAHELNPLFQPTLRVRAI